MTKKPSELIRHSLKALKAISADDKYTIDFNVWHDTELNNTHAHVGVAGAYMAVFLGVLPTQYRTLGDFLDTHIANTDPLDSQVFHRLEAIEHLRRGRVFWGTQVLGLHSQVADLHNVPETYNAEFIGCMLSLQMLLEREGN